jgi:hypothetical protein
VAGGAQVPRQSAEHLVAQKTHESRVAARPAFTLAATAPQDADENGGP